MDKTAFSRLCLSIVMIPMLSGCAAPGPVARSGEKPVMIYDTATGQIVGNDVYNVKEP